MTDARMEQLVGEARSLIERYSDNLSVECHWNDVFLSVTNDQAATDIARKVAQCQRHTLHEMPLPMRWSEDFGRIGGDGAKAAMLYVGAGTDHPQLHNPDYDFPDALIPIVSNLFSGVVDAILGRARI
jgi:metal-dependent amidase/aminoacylase/carboxypeptidase family protein